uniref:Uncharacterized protein n=1 Tax=Acrobeloides nanus TaxID=290746 RepID=A0A914EKT4_9BILA
MTAPNISSLLLPPPCYPETLLQQNIAATALSIQMAMSPDIVRLAADTNAVSLAENDDLDQPLDLSVKKNTSSLTVEGPSTSSIARPSVIRNGYTNGPPTRTVEVKRSASSVSYRNSPEPDVSDHFKRSLSGKWPRRSTNYAHYTPPSLSSQSQTNLSTSSSATGGSIDQRSLSPKNMPKRLPPTVGATRSNSMKVGNSARYAQIIIENDHNVEDHFRKALGDQYEKLLKKAQESSNSTNEK